MMIIYELNVLPHFKNKCLFLWLKMVQKRTHSFFLFLFLKQTKLTLFLKRSIIQSAQQAETLILEWREYVSSKKKGWSRFFATTFSPFGLTFFNFIFAFLPISFFFLMLTSSYSTIF
jgi:hypothetical protein